MNWSHQFARVQLILQEGKMAEKNGEHAAFLVRDLQDAISEGPNCGIDLEQQKLVRNILDETESYIKSGNWDMAISRLEDAWSKYTPVG